MTEDSSSSGLPAVTPALSGARLTLADFARLATTVAGYPYVKLVLDQETATVHLIDGAARVLHVQYVAETILGMTRAELARDLDAFNDSVYRAEDRRFLLGTLALHRRDGGEFFSLETVEVDTMGAELLLHFYRTVRALVDDALPVLLKPANHAQEGYLAGIGDVPTILAHELYSSAPYVPLNPGTTTGRLRVFGSVEDYRTTAEPVRWHDILVMARMPDDIPRVSGLVNAEHTTPLSHTNVLAAGWGIPNAIELGALDSLAALDGQWVELTVDMAALTVRPAARPDSVDAGPPWAITRVDIGKPDLAAARIRPLGELRATDANRFGTKAANLGELTDVLAHGSPHWLGFYTAPRPPRANLLGYLARHLGVTTTDTAELSAAALRLVKEHVVVPRGIALPFALQQRFLESSPAIQQTIGKLKMALTLGGPVDELCTELGALLRDTPLPAELRALIEDAVTRHLTGVDRVVVRSSSNAEDLIGFSAAGIYESVPHVESVGELIDAIKRVWASLVTTRSVLLRAEAGIGLDDCFMGVVIQEQLPAPLGGVLVSANPLDPADFRNVLLNMARDSVDDVVSGTREPLQHLYNTMEGGSRTVALGSEPSDVDDRAKATLGVLALVGRLLQAHFADGAVDVPVDVEWLVDGDRIALVQCRPYQLTT